MHDDILFEMDPLASTSAAVLLLGDPCPLEWGGDQARPASAAEAVERLASGEALLILSRPDALHGPLAAALAAAPAAGLVLVLDRREDDLALDAVGALLDLPDLLFLAADTPLHEARAHVRALQDRMSAPAGVADGSMEFTSGFRLEALRQDAERVARALAELAAGQPQAEADSQRPITAARIRAHLRARRSREQFFGPDLFADPAWDMLLDLSAAQMEGQRVSVSSLCIAAAVPTTTALRWIKTLIDRGILAREQDPEDGRRAFISLSVPATSAMELCLMHVLNAPGQ